MNLSIVCVFRDTKFISVPEDHCIMIQSCSRLAPSQFRQERNKSIHLLKSIRFQTDFLQLVTYTRGKSSRVHDLGIQYLIVFPSF